MTKKKTNEEFLCEMNRVNPCIVPLTDYTDSHTKLVFHCTICGREWTSYPYQELNRKGLGCAKCSYKAAGIKRRKTNSKFVEELGKINPNITLLDQYTTEHAKIKCLCNLCNNVWEATPDSLLRGVGCPNCYHSATSFVEQFIYYAMSFVLGDNRVLSRDRKAIGKELDIYIPSLKLAIEYGSWYWHKSRIKNDFEKQKICEKNNIKLILIYDSCDDETLAAHGGCYTFKYSLAAEKSYSTVKQIITSICNAFSLDCSCLPDNWGRISNLAHQKSRRITTSDFVELVKAKNSHNITILGEYRSSYDAILCRCNDCGYEWSPRPNNLINEDAGCPRCSGNIHYTNQEFVSKVALLNPEFELLEPYTKSGKSILCRCRICGYEWRASPTNLLKKRLGCPKCIGFAHYSNEDFIKKLKTINPDVTPLDPYPKNNKTKILCHCNNCGSRFSMRPNSLLSGEGCPKCSKAKRVQESVKGNEQFLEELKVINSKIEPLEDYYRSKAKIACRCKQCGNEWMATPNSLLHGYGCPECAKKEKAKKLEKKVLCVETNTIYCSLKEASMLSGISNSAISMCCNGKKKSAGGYHWEYLEKR